MLNLTISEKRAARRVYAKIPLTCHIVDPKDGTVKKKTTMMGDISETGLYFESDEPFSLRTEMSFSFKLPESDTVIQGKGRIARIQTTDEERVFGVGINFSEVTDESRREIHDFVERIDIRKLLQMTVDKKGSDLHILADHAPVLRVQGELQELEIPPIPARDIPRLIYSVMTKQQIRRFEQNKELDFGMQFDMQNRFRVNLHIQRGYMEAAFRLIVTRTFSFTELHIPEAVKDLARIKEGLILICGPTGSGKSTTIAAMVDLINHERKAVIITLERPIEYVFENDKCIIKQREIGIDTNSFSQALQSSLRQDPNIIIVGELDDMETVKTALIAAEAGYLVIASFHAPNTVSGIDRLTGMFPMESRKQILAQVSNSMKGMITQMLIPSVDKKKRVLASEVLMANEAVKRVIRSDELYQIPNVIQTGVHYKMQSMQESIRRYVESGVVDKETAQFYLQEAGVFMR